MRVPHIMPCGSRTRDASAKAALLLAVSLASALLSACYAGEAAAPRGSALDPSATTATERDPVDVLGDEFDPFSAYPELTPDQGGGHQHHPGMQMGDQAHTPPAAAPSTPSEDQVSATSAPTPPRPAASRPAASGSASATSASPEAAARRWSCSPLGPE